MTKIYLLRKTMSYYEAVDIETGQVNYINTNKSEFLEDSIEDCTVLIIDKTFKDSL